MRSSKESVVRKKPVRTLLDFDFKTTISSDATATTASKEGSALQQSKLSAATEDSIKTIEIDCENTPVVTRKPKKRRRIHEILGQASIDGINTVMRGTKPKARIAKKRGSDKHASDATAFSEQYTASPLKRRRKLPSFVTSKLSVDSGAITSVTTLSRTYSIQMDDTDSHLSKRHIETRQCCDSSAASKPSTAVTKASSKASECKKKSSSERMSTYARICDALPDLSALTRVCVFDTETTGFSERDSVIEIGAVAICNGRLQPRDSFYTLVKPLRKYMHKDAFATHGLSLRKCYAEGVPMREALNAFDGWLRTGRSTPPVRTELIVAHNASFDLRQLDRCVRVVNAKRRGKQRKLPLFSDAFLCFDTLKYWRKTQGSGKLDDLCRVLGVDMSSRSQRHGALIDATLTAKCLLRLFELEQLKKERARGKSDAKWLTKKKSR